jgi:hypothetical protein
MSSDEAVRELRRLIVEGIGKLSCTANAELEERRARLERAEPAHLGSNERQMAKRQPPFSSRYR